MTPPHRPRTQDAHDVYRDENGDPVVLTEQQVAAVIHAMQVVEVVRREEGYGGSIWSFPEPMKSRLLGRMLIDGRPPLAEKPPHWVGGCGYHLVEGAEIGHYYFGSTPMSGRMVDGKFVIDPDDPRVPHNGG